MEKATKHWYLHIPGQWNKRWGEFLENNPQLKEVFQFLDMLMDEFCLDVSDVYYYRK